MSKTRAGNLVDLLLVVGCLLVGSTVARQWIRAAEALPPLSVHVRPGDTAEVIPGLSYGPTNSTLLVYLRSTCRYCSASMPFYRKLADEAAKKSVRVVVVHSESGPAITQYLAANDLPEVVWHRGRVLSTPTLIEIDRTGLVRNVWAGLLDGSGERRVLEALGRP